MVVGLPGPESYPELAGGHPQDLGKAFAAWHRSKIPANRLGVVDAAVDEGCMAHDLGWWHASTAEGRGAAAELAFGPVSPEVGIALLYCEPELVDE
jgi:hypothetical protein